MSNLPRYALKLLLRIKRNKFRDDIAGDFEEIYEDKHKNSGYISAQFWFWKEIFKSLPKFFKTRIYWSKELLKSYLKTALRSIIKHKGFTFLNISGLSVGIACSLLILFYIDHEVNYDGYHDDIDRIFHVGLKIERSAATIFSARTSAPLVPTLREDFPEVEHSLRIMKPWWQITVTLDNKKFVENNILIADNELFDIFKFNFIHGDPKSALLRPSTVVLTESTARQYFDRSDPIGNSIMIGNALFEITGIIEDVPSNTHLKFDFVFSLKTLESSWDFTNWGWTSFFAYVKLAENTDHVLFGDKIVNIADNYLGDKLKEWGESYSFLLEPVSDIHLHSEFEGSLEPPGNVLYVYLLALIGIFLLSIACINYMNLSTARSMNRIKEVGMRKVIGARRDQLIRQFLFESFLITLISGILAMIIAAAALPYFDQLTGMSYKPGDIFSIKAISVIFLLSALIGISAGSYPAFFLSMFKPASILRGAAGSSTGNRLTRKFLVTGQFAISLIMIISTSIVYKQIDFMKNRDLGFDKEQKLIVNANAGQNYEYIKNEFLKNPSVMGASYSWSVPGRMTNLLTTEIVGQADNKSQSISYDYVDPDFISEYKIEMVAGRVFQKNMLSDLNGTFIINESAVRSLGFGTPENAIGKKIKEGGSSLTGTIIGVCRDYHFKGLQSAIEPLILQYNPQFFRTLNLTLETDNIGETILNIEKKWNEMQLGTIFNYFFLDDDFNSQYGSEERTQRLFLIFTAIAIFIACLGLFALASYTAEQKVKEIGIRKTLGASVFGLVGLISRDFLILVGISNLIAWPAAYFIMNNWLNEFAYRTEIGIFLFLGSGILAMLITLFTVGFQSIRAAVANPVDSLRYE
ncbi:ABC transporter permease [candidate division KSB1 bacterium]